jgi:hypothetical protein
VCTTQRTCREDYVTRDEREQVIDTMLAGYRHPGTIGATVVGDDHSLCRLLRMLEFSGPDKDVGEYLCSFLTA